MRFLVNFYSKICRFYCRTNGKWPNRGKRYLKFSRFYCAARRIWRKRVGKRVRNDSKPYKTNGKPPNGGSGKYSFGTKYFFGANQKKCLIWPISISWFHVFGSNDLLLCKRWPRKVLNKTCSQICPGCGYKTCLLEIDTVATCLTHGGGGR